MFICECKYRGSRAAIRWDNGEVYPVDEIRDDGLYNAVKMEAISLIGEIVGAIPDGTTTEHLKDDLSAFMIIARVMEIEKTSGDVPVAPQDEGENAAY